MIDEKEANQRIRELRDHLGLGRAAFADETGIEKKTVENLEHGRQRVNAIHLKAIASRWPEYRLWLAYGDTIPDAGQISPEIDKAHKTLDTAGKTG